MKSSTTHRILTLPIALILLFSIISSVLADDTTNPLIEFLEPTPDNNDYQTHRYVNINVSIQEENLDTLNYNWNGTNYTMYDDTLVLMYNFDKLASLGEDSSTVVDMTGNGNSGSVTQATWTSLGKYNGAFDFDGTGDSITTSIDLDTYSSFTVTGWVYPRDTGESGTRTGFFGQNDAFETLWDGTTLNYWTESGDCDITVEKNQWVHLALQYHSSTIYIYKNGALANSVSGGGSSSYNFNIGGGGINSETGNTLDGIIDEIRIWNRCLTEDEIYQQYVLNLQKYNSTQWYLTVNQSKDATSQLEDGVYTYQVFAEDTGSLQTTSPQRTIYINVDPTPPVPELSSFLLVSVGLLLSITIFKTKKKR